jgi:hypothetical protein
LGGDAVDDDLALAQAQVALVEQTRAHEALEQAQIAGEHPEQGERRRAGRHQGLESGLHLGGIGRTGGSDARGGGVRGHEGVSCAMDSPSVPTATEGTRCDPGACRRDPSNR